MKPLKDKFRVKVWWEVTDKVHREVRDKVYWEVRGKVWREVRDKVRDKIGD